MKLNIRMNKKSNVPFKKYMKILVLFMIIFNINLLEANAASLDIDCSNNQCTSVDLTNAFTSCSTIVNKTQCDSKVIGNLCHWIDDSNANGGYCTSIPLNKNCSGYNCQAGSSISLINIKGLMNLDINLLTSQTGNPQNVGMSISNGDFPGKNGNFVIASNNQSSNSGSIVLIADNFNNLNINLDGYNGLRGKHSSEICAENIKNGNYGISAQNYFNNRRATTNADPNKCDSDDINYLQSFNFTCDDPSYQEISASNPVVQVNQVKKMARCSAVGTYNLCIKKKVQVTCNFKLWSTFRQKFIENGEYLSNNSASGSLYSYYNGPTTVNYTYESCGLHDYTCSGTQIAEIDGQNLSDSPFKECGSKMQSSTFVNACSSGSGSYGEIYKKIVNTVTDKIAGMPLSRSSLGSSSTLQFEEAYFLSEINRLGSVDKFCEQNAGSFLPSKTSSDWWGGVSGAPNPTQTSNPSFSGKYLQTSGIPWEELGESASNNIGSLSGANLNWQNETRTQYEPSFNSETITTECSGYCFNTTKYKFRAKTAIWKPSGSTYTYSSPGLNTDGTSLASGSSWQLMQTNVFESCPSGWTVLKPQYLNLVQYTNKENTSCSGITDPLDPYNRALWQYTGISQDPSFGTETVSCGIGSCAVGSTVSELNRNLDIIQPGNGENGTEQGRGLVFIYDVKNLNSSSMAGSFGSVGNSDIFVNPQTRICAKINDANSGGINSEEAKNPFVSFKKFKWEALKSGTNSNPGAPPANTGKTIEVYKKLDPALRYFLEKQLL